MVDLPYEVSGDPALVWVYPDALTVRLDSATWIETTRELLKLGWDVTLLTRDPLPGPQTLRGIEIISLRSRDIYLLGQILFHLNIILYVLRRWRRVDILLFTQLSGFWLLFPLRFIRFLTRRRRPVLVMDTRDIDDSVPGNLRIQLRIWFQQLVFWLANILADGQTVITPRMADLVAVPENQLLGIWPSGVDPETFAPAIFKRTWPQEDEPLHLMYLGILLETRHPVELCQAVEHANESGMNVHLSLVGDGPGRSILEPFVEKTAGRIRIVPPVPHDQIPRVLAHAHVGVTSLPGPEDLIYQASSPIKLFEYMAAGLPILATRNVCHTDIIGDGDYAFWADRSDVDSLFLAVSESWDRRADLEILGQEARNSVLDWTWQAAGRKLSEALANGLARSA